MLKKAFTALSTTILLASTANLAFGAIYQCPSIQQIKNAKYTCEGSTADIHFECTVKIKAAENSDVWLVRASIDEPRSPSFPTDSAEMKALLNGVSSIQDASASRSPNNPAFCLYSQGDDGRKFVNVVLIPNQPLSCTLIGDQKSGTFNCSAM